MLTDVLGKCFRLSAATAVNNAGFLAIAQLRQQVAVLILSIPYIVKDIIAFIALAVNYRLL
jgi:hypothetical protein